MTMLESLRAFSAVESPLPPQAQVWDCFNQGQVLAAAFEVHEVAIEAGFLPDEATTLSLSLADLGTQAVLHARGGVASVFFSKRGWRLEVADSGPTRARLGRLGPPLLESDLPRPLTSLRGLSSGRCFVAIAEYHRADDA